jgi:hypothetical protein
MPTTSVPSETRSHLVATFGGRLEAGYSMTGGEPSDIEAIFVRLDAGQETAAISLDRQVFEAGIAHEDGAISLQLGGVEFRDRPTCHPAGIGVELKLAGRPGDLSVPLLLPETRRRSFERDERGMLQWATQTPAARAVNRRWPAPQLQLHG